MKYEIEINEGSEIKSMPENLKLVIENYLKKHVIHQYGDGEIKEKFKNQEEAFIEVGYKKDELSKKIFVNMTLYTDSFKIDYSCVTTNIHGAISSDRVGYCSDKFVKADYTFERNRDGQSILLYLTLFKGC